MNLWIRYARCLVTRLQRGRLLASWRDFDPARCGAGDRFFLLHTALSRTNTYTSSMVLGLFTSSASKKQIDLKLDSSHHSPTALALDTTISCTLFF